MTAQRPLLGAALLATAMLCFSLSDAAAKQLAPQLSPTQVAWYRFALLALTVVPLALRTPALWRSRRPLLQSVRAAALVGSALLFLNGLRLMPIAEATAMVFASPLFVTLLATLLLRETMTPWRWLPVVCGFAGVLTVLRPGSFAFGGAEVFPMLSSLAWAV
ncbi:MAG TPA: DMT family transporter, partial [Burkholderiaceae bacterium]|nr:DMT family transporter [Burkholderiaceae bacterium]